MAGLSETGFTIKRLPEVVDSSNTLAVSLFQDLLEPGDSVSTDSSGVIGRLVALGAPSVADLWEVAQQVNSAFDANAATGISLDNMILLSGIPARFENTFTTSQVLLSGDTGTLISAGNVVSSPTTSAQFTILNDVLLSPENTSGVTVTSVIVSDSTTYTLSFTRQATTQVVTVNSGIGATRASILTAIKSDIDTNHTDILTSFTTNGDLKLVLADIFLQTTFSVSDNLGVVKVDKLGDVRAVNAGPIAQPINTITQIQTTRLGWDSVTNPVAAVSGRLRETDEELRLRFRNTKFERAGNIVEAVYSALFSLNDVQQVFIDDNNTSITNANGTPGHSFLVLVDGGTSSEIARAIWDNRGAGVASVGNTSVMITDKFGYQREIKFSRPTPVNIFIQLQLTTDQNFPENGQDLIKQAIIDYVNALSIGQDVLYSRLYTPINSIPGHQVDSLLIGTTSPGTGVANIVVNFDGIGQVLPENITFI